MEAPVAAADRLVAVGTSVSVGAVLLMIDIGAGCEATVVRRGAAGFEVLSTLADAQAGGWCIEERLTATLAADAAPASAPWWRAAAAVRASRQQLTEQAVVAVPALTGPPMMVHAALVDEIAEPVLRQAGDLAMRALDAAETSVDQCAAIYLIGGAASRMAATTIGSVLGADAVPLADPGAAAVWGAAGLGTAAHPALAEAGPPVPPLRRLFGILVPGIASLLLFCHMVFTATFHNGTPAAQRYGYYVLASWGELTTSAVFALTASLAAGSLLGTLLAQAMHHDGAPAPDAMETPSRVAGGILLAVATGLSVAALYGIATAVYFGVPVSGPLGWALWPILPTAALACGLAWLAGRRPVTPPQGWDTMLRFPISSVALTALGTILLTSWWHGPLPDAVAGWSETIGRAGGVLIGVGVASTLVRHWALRTGLGAFLALIGFLIVGNGGIRIIAVVYTTAVTLWWAYRLFLLRRLTTPAHAAHR